MKASHFSVFAAAVILIAVSCSDKNNLTPNTVIPERPTLSDNLATARTRALYENLIDLMDKGTMFGAQIPTEYGLSGGAK